jgi:hypothetical protein
MHSGVESDEDTGHTPGAGRDGGEGRGAHPFDMVFKSKDTSWTAHVVGNEVVNDGSDAPHAVFIVEVCISLEALRVKRRYKRFRDLQRSVRGGCGYGRERHSVRSCVARGPATVPCGGQGPRASRS